MSDTAKARVELEREELNNKMDKLKAFLSSVAFNKLDEVQQHLLWVQLYVMNSYSEVLYQRLTAWK